MDTARELLDAYPHCSVAIAFTELIICVPPDGEDQSSWDLMMNAPTPMTLDRVIEMIRDVINDEIMDGTECKAEEALEQSYHSSYRIYIAGKMGMV